MVRVSMRVFLGLGLAVYLLGYIPDHGHGATAYVWNDAFDDVGVVVADVTR
jgi:hypothetical protein